MSVFNDVVFQTVISGVLIFVVKELVSGFLIQPIKEYKGVVGKIDNRLKYFSNVITNSGLEREIVLESSNTMRELSCDLESTYKQIPCRSQISFFRIIPNKKNNSDSAKSLIRISNAGGQSGREERNSDEILKIRKWLNIEEI